jgi:Tol biopolymer transport system component
VGISGPPFLLGNQIAFSSDRGHAIVPHPIFPFARQRIGDIYKMDISGENIMRLTDSESWDGSPVWSVDGSKIIFYSQRLGNTTIFEMNADGKNQTQFIEFSGPAVSPKWVSNGKIAFTTWQGEDDFKVMQFDITTKDITPIFTNSPDLMFNPDFHPNGLIVFHGGKYAQNKGQPGNFGFDGDVLAKIPPLLSFADKQLNVFGVRRAFVAPPQVGSPHLFYDADEMPNKENPVLHFYQVNYSTGERNPLFSFEKDSSIHPSNFRVLDSKVSSDGKYFIFTTGSFRADPNTQGNIWKYDFETKIVSKLADSPYNDGFADISEDGKMVFRSGRDGYFDIYLKTRDTLINLTQDTHRDNFPAISKQGDKIVFSSDRLRSENEYKTMDIFLIKLQTNNSWSEPEKISLGKGQNAHAHFSPDGKWIIYTTEGYGINDEQALVEPIIFSPQMYGNRGL